jgi:hypothetical protein
VFEEGMVVYTDDTDAKLYINNVLNDTDSTADGDITASASYYIGAYRTTDKENPNGALDYLVVWDYAINDTERADFYTYMRSSASKSVDVEPTYYDLTNTSYNMIWQTTNATGSPASFNFSFDGTEEGNTYKMYIDLATDEEIGSLVCTADGQVLWGNTTNVSDNTFFVAETGYPDTKFEYWDSSTWDEGPANWYMWHEGMYWWHNQHPNLYQTYTQPTLKITNNGTGTGTPYMWLDINDYTSEADSKLNFYIDNDPILNGDTITLGWGETNKTAVHTALGPSESVELWNWAASYGYDGEFDFNVTAEVQ